ncbi:hypothetical protein DMB95_02800 [Campylobacter sp. MIT 12-8780]|uniref:hypothetical protein n=1 Tax=unclassified Campylobacter TaxID=2593542 RepID=UPI00115DB65A|nr:MULTISPECIES: hypothetical protein [unclassified Campylobacter]NDJ27003.1 hypothetical protein [Campylobacter sp. MIT 19-121]TQR41858.1 hypothetical protein DMB95_02800 [Campylobacter sp. MIT 12-8780]
MKKYSFFAVLAVLFLGLLVAIFSLFFSENDIVPNFDDLQEESKAQVSIQEQNNQTWQDRFANLSPKNYTPAVEQFSMVFTPDTSQYQPKSKFFQLIVDKNDVYSLFCLKQTLNFFKVKYSLTSTGTNTEIFLDTDNQNLLKDIQARLKIYDINTQIKEIWL